MTKTINFATRVRHKPDRERLVRLINRTTIYLVASYLMVFVVVFGLSFYFQAKLKSLNFEAEEKTARLVDYEETESRLIALKKRIKIVQELKTKDGEGLAAGVERLMDLINDRSVINKLSVSGFGQGAEVTLTDQDLNDLLAVFEDTSSFSEDEGGYTSVRMAFLRKNDEGVYEYGFNFVLD